MAPPNQSSAQNGYFFEDLSVGTAASATRTVTESDIVKFADVSGDHNPVHLDAAFAATTMFKERIAHGMLAASFISALIAGELPGRGSIYVSQNLKFKAPVKIGDEVTTRLEVTSLVPEKKFVVLKTQSLVRDKVVIDGEATIMVPSRG